MKKITSLFLAVLIITLSVFSVNAFALPATETDAPPVTETDPVPETELLSQKWFKEHGNEFTADASASVLGIVTAQKGKVWVKDDKSAQIITFSTNKSQINKKTVNTEKGAFSFYPDFPLFYFKETSNGMLSNTAAKKFSFIEAETTDEGYYVEKFATADKYTEVVMAFKNEELERFYIVDSIGILYEYIITSYEVDDSEFDIPFLAINITPLYRLFVLLGIVK